MKKERTQAFKAYMKRVVNLSDHVDLAMADCNIRNNIQFRGPNVYILAFAIVIASVGLNVNSIPVIIGAMLISPLMGPIFGMSLGFGTNDMKLIVSSLKNLGLMVAISIIASTLYFVMTPLDLENPTELLARTNPTIYDVMIALFGGAAGMLETSRKEKGTVMSGVAIATALMPPLCTAGFGLATLNWHYAVGALYLFCINCVFISLASVLIVKLLHFPLNTLQDPSKDRKRNYAVAILLVIIIVPSIMSAISVIQENNRNIAVSHFIDSHRTLDKSYIYDHKVEVQKVETVNHKGRKKTRKETVVELYMAGESLDAMQRASLEDEAGRLGFVLNIHDGAASQSLTERELFRAISEQNDVIIKEKDAQIKELSDSLRQYESRMLPADQLAKEIASQVEVKKVSVARAETVEGDGVSEEVLVVLTAPERIPGAEIEKLEKWLKVRTGSERLTVIQQ